MFKSPTGSDNVSTDFQLPTYQPDKLCHILLGDRATLIAAINRMEILGYCDRLAWIDPIPTGRNGEHISLMSRNVSSSNR